jgi:outer membrane protein TolC
VGVVSRVEVVEAEAGVAEGDFARIVADNQYENSNDRLIDAILGPYLTGDSTLVFETTDAPEDFVYYEIDVEAAVATAFKNRPDLLAARQEIERRGFDLKLAKNLRLPQLDVKGSYGYVGISGKSNPVCSEPGSFCNPTSVDGTFPDSTRSYFTDRGANNATIRAIFSVPLGNRTASKRVTQREIEVRRSKTLERQLEQRIIVDVRQAARTVDAAQRGIQASERRKAAATEQLRAERIRLEHGESTPFDVLLKLRDLVEAESQNIGAFQAYRNAVTSLNRQQGTILEQNNVNIEEVATLR